MRRWLAGWVLLALGMAAPAARAQGPQLPPSRITPQCMQTITPGAFDDPDGFTQFFQQCYAKSIEPADITVVSLGWINPKPNPFETWAGPYADTMRQLGPLMKGLPNGWVALVYMGLIATANPRPDLSQGLESFRARKQYRSMLGARIRVVINPQTGVPSALVSNVKVDGGWTPPFDRNSFLLTYFAPLGKYFGVTVPTEPLADPTFYPAEYGSVSGVVAGKHPNSMLSIPASETILADGLIRFRAGPHTDEVGISIGSPVHVPWVWSEFAVTYDRNAKIHVRGLAAGFPTQWWFVNGKRVKCQPRLSDNFFPFGTGGIDTSKLRLYPAISVGAPASGPQAPDDRPSGPIYPHAYTLGPGGPQWDYVLGGPVPQSPAGPACD